MTAAEGRLF